MGTANPSLRDTSPSIDIALPIAESINVGSPDIQLAVSSW